MDQLEMAIRFIDGMSGSFGGGISPVEKEAAIFDRSWRIALQKIGSDVFLLYGGRDDNIPISLGRYMDYWIPCCQARFIEREGQVSLAG